MLDVEGNNRPLCTYTGAPPNVTTKYLPPRCLHYKNFFFLFPRSVVYLPLLANFFFCQATATTPLFFYPLDSIAISPPLLDTSPSLVVSKSTGLPPSFHQWIGFRHRRRIVFSFLSRTFSTFQQGRIVALVVVGVFVTLTIKSTTFFLFLFKVSSFASPLHKSWKEKFQTVYCVIFSDSEK